MKIVTLEDFRKLPIGTLFMKYEPCIFQDLCAKGETWESDFLYENITCELECTGLDNFTNKLYDAQENGTSVAMDFDNIGRDGCYDNDQLFAVYERKDIDMLIDKLNRCRDLAYI